MVKALLAVPGIDVNREAADGGTALHSATNLGRLSVIEALLDAPGIDVHAVNASGRTPLYFACAKSLVSVVNFLIKAGADVSGRDARGASLLDAACASATRNGGTTAACVRAVKERAGPVLMTLLRGGLPSERAEDIVIQGFDEGWERTVAELLRAGAT